MSKRFLVSQNINSQDRLGDLPDFLILHILSFIETKDTVRTCVLSNRWRYLWVSVPCLNFSSKSFTRLFDFKKFVLWVLSHRDTSQVKVLIYNCFAADYATDQYLLNKVIEHATSHGVEEIRINLMAKNSGTPPVQIPLSLFTCPYLKRLEFKDCILTNASSILDSNPTNASSLLGSKSLEMLHLEHFAMYPTKDDISNPFARYAKLFSFTTLTTMHLNNVPLCCTNIGGCLDPFVSCANLKSLYLSEMSFLFDMCPENFVISAPQLRNLSLMCNNFKCKIVVAAPQLTNFSYLYSWPSAYFEFSLPTLDGLNIDIHGRHDRLENTNLDMREEMLHGLINMSRGCHNSEAVKVSICTVKVTCGTPVLLRPECLFLSKLKALNLQLGSTHKIFIDNFEHIATYFRKCSEHADFHAIAI